MNDYEQWDGEVYTGNYNSDIQQSLSSSLFSEELLGKCQFKWPELAGKELTIRVGQTPDEYGKGMHICVVGVDKTDGKCYVLHTGIEEK